MPDRPVIPFPKSPVKNGSQPTASSDDNRHFVVVYVDDAGGQPATIHSGLAAAKTAIITYLDERDRELRLPRNQFLQLRHALDGVTGDDVYVVQGAACWSEQIILSPLDAVSFDGASLHNLTR